MRYVVAAMILSGLIFLQAPSGMASPNKRLDEATQTCRLLNFHNAGWKSEGAKIFKSSCKNCHYRDNDKGATFLHTGSKTMKGWNRVFFTKFPECAKSGEWDHLSQEQLLALNDFLFMNASNTYDPNSARDCG